DSAFVDLPGNSIAPPCKRVSKPSNVARSISWSLSAVGSTKFDFRVRIVSSISAGARESTVTFGSAEALDAADGLGVCAQIPEAMLAIRAPVTIVFIFIEPHLGGTMFQCPRAQSLCVGGAQGNIAAEMAPLEMNLP